MEVETNLTTKLDKVCEKFKFASITCVDLDGCLVFSSSAKESGFISQNNIFLKFEEKEIFIERFRNFNLIFSGKDLEISKILKISKCLQKIVEKI